MKKVMLALILTGTAFAGPHLQYVGGVSICAEDPGKLAAFYEKLGISTKPLKEPEGYFGGFQWEKVDFHFGLYKKGAQKVWCDEAAPTFGVSFRVSDYDGYLKKVVANGLKPFDEMTAPEGRFALFRDPEGNFISIWGK